jgi:hypothetical protein
MGEVTPIRRSLWIGRALLLLTITTALLAGCFVVAQRINDSHEILIAVAIFLAVNVLFGPLFWEWFGRD